jgi:hypothetical protein
MSTRNLPGGKKRPVRSADNFAEYLKMWEPQTLTALRAYTACIKIALPYRSSTNIFLFILKGFAMRWCSNNGSWSLQQEKGCIPQQNAEHVVRIGPIEDSALLAVRYITIKNNILHPHCGRDCVIISVT